MQCSPLVLTILDGFGHATTTKNNAIAQAKTPFLDRLYQQYPHTLLNCSGNSVGLPEGQIGNSEVGHMHIGAGRVIPQALSKITNALTETNLPNLPLLKTALTTGKDIHLLGLLSDGGVHAHIGHFIAIIKLARLYKSKIYIHGILDGRDTPPRSAEQYLTTISKYTNEQVVLASLSGRYYAMDRDNNWQRTQLAYNGLTNNPAYQYQDAFTALAASYARNENDEFMQPSICSEHFNGIVDDDIVIFMNFRADRTRQLTRAFVDNNFNKFTRHKIKLTQFITMTEYDQSLATLAIFPTEYLTNTVSEVISKANFSQLKIAETEKYAHVTYFFNGGSENTFAKEDRIMIPSPKVATYDLKPEMSAMAVTETLINNLAKYDFIVCNFANADMVGHTGKLTPTIVAIEVLDNCLAKIYAALQPMHGKLLITADHGNAEMMYNHQTDQQHTAHTSNLVPCILTDQQKHPTTTNGSLIDIAPTILSVLKLPIPAVMTGKVLFS